MFNLNMLWTLLNVGILVVLIIIAVLLVKALLIYIRKNKNDSNNKN